jgi:anti-sigma factor RsiW
MNPTFLHALIIDRHFGELSPEATELLELHLAQNAEARAEAERVLQSLAVAREAVLQYPELSRVAPAERTETPARRRLAGMPWLARAAAIVLLAALAAAGGFVAGRSGPKIAGSETASPEVNPPQTTPPKAGPWARYRMQFDPTGSGMQVVRVDTTELE